MEGLGRGDSFSNKCSYSVKDYIPSLPHNTLPLKPPHTNSPCVKSVESENPTMVFYRPGE